MAISICSGNSGTGSDAPTFCTRKQGLHRSCLSWSSTQSWTVRQVQGLIGDIIPKMKAKGTPVVSSSDPASSYGSRSKSNPEF